MTSSITSSRPCSRTSSSALDTSVLSERGPQPPTPQTSEARPTAAQRGPSRPESTVRVAAAIRATVHAPTQWGAKA